MMKIWALVALISVAYSVEIRKVRERGQDGHAIRMVNKSLRSAAPVLTGLRVRSTSKYGTNQVVRMEQVVQGLKVFGYGVTAQNIADNAKRGVKATQIVNGELVENIEHIVTTADVSKMEAEKPRMFNLARTLTQKRETLQKSSKTAELAQDVQSIIYVDPEADLATPAFLVRYVDETANTLSHPHVILSATGKLLEQFEGLQSLRSVAEETDTNIEESSAKSPGSAAQDPTPGIGSGPGGNEKIGRIDYDNIALGDLGNGRCQYLTAEVLTRDLDHGSDTTGTDPFVFDCYRNEKKEINGAFSPLNDAHVFGKGVFDMFGQIYDTTPIEEIPLKLNVHYQNGYENAFYSNGVMTFGDGRDTFFPLTSLDVVAHEVAHGVTDQTSGLIYARQSGGLNEAFSDMAGKAVERFVRTRDRTTFAIGFDIFKPSTPPGLRCMDDPPCDRRSIDHVRDYFNGLDVHYSSGIFNKAYYLIASHPFSINDHLDAFDIFFVANTRYWSENTGYTAGAELTLQAVVDMKAGMHFPERDFSHFDLEMIRDSFFQLGIDCTGTDGDFNCFLLR